MAVDSNGLSTDSAAEKIIGLLGDEGAEPAAETPIENLSDEAKADRIGSEAEPEGEVTDASKQTGEPESPAIEPPVSWKAEAKEKFKALPLELQKYVTERESERESNYGKTLQDLSAKEKATIAKEQAVQTERHQYAERLKYGITLAENMDPVLAQGRRTNWVQEHHNDPLGAPARFLQYQQREGLLQQFAQEYSRVTNQVSQDSLKQAHEQLSTKLDFWGDESKRATFQKELRTFLKAEGLDDGAISGLNHPVAITVARKAMLYDQLMAQQSKIADHKKAPAPNTRVLKTQASESGDKSDRMATALKRVKSTSRLDEQAALIEAALQ